MHFNNRANRRNRNNLACSKARFPGAGGGPERLHSSPGHIYSLYVLPSIIYEIYIFSIGETGRAERSASAWPERWFEIGFGGRVTQFSKFYAQRTCKCTGQGLQIANLTASAAR